MKSSVGASLYRGIVKRRKTVLAVSILVTVLVFFVDVSLGPMRYGLAEVIQAIFNPDPESVIYSVVWESRIPEALTALLVGLALGMAGAEMQTILDNPLAEPYTLGISTSAAFGASLVIAFGLGGSVFGDYAQPVLAFACAILTCFVIYSVARSRSGDRNTIILLGVAMLFLFQSLVSLIQSVSSRDSANAIMFWMFGSLDRTEWVDLLIIAVVIAIAAVFFAMLITCPSEEKHQEAVGREISAALTDGIGRPDTGSTVIDALGGMFGSAITAQIVNVMIGQTLTVDDYFIFSVGRLHYDGKDKTVSLGVLGHVFTFDSDDIRDAVDGNRPTPDTMAV